MKENLKNKKGITLIALVITIIVLLILAIVTIRIMTNQNIIGHANNAVTAYNEAQTNEMQQLTWVEELMKNKGGSSVTGGSTTNQSNQAISSLTEEELATLKAAKTEDVNGSTTYTVAVGNGNGNTLIEAFNNEGVGPGVLVVLNSENETSVDMVGIFTTTNSYVFQENQWFIVDDNSDFSPYTGECPVNKSQFGNIICESYLDKVIATFNN